MTSQDEPEYCNDFSVQCECFASYRFYGHDETILLGLVTPPIVIFGLLANITSVRIFTHRLMISSSINWYLAVLSCSDILILFSAFFVLSLPRIGEYAKVWSATSFSYWISPYMYGLMTLSQTISVWMTTGMSVHRFIGVCLPFRATKLLRSKCVILFITLLLVFSALFNSTKLFEVRVVNNCYRWNIATYIPVISATDLRRNSTYQLIFFGWAYTIMMFVVPFTILIVVNLQVLTTIRRSNRYHRRISRADDSFKKTERKERQISIMLIAIVVVFLSCNTLALVVNIMENIGYEGRIYTTLVTYDNFLVIVNASCNVGIYMLFSKKYRQILWNYLACRDENRLLLLTSAMQ